MPESLAAYYDRQYRGLTAMVDAVVGFSGEPGTIVRYRAAAAPRCAYCGLLSQLTPRCDGCGAPR